MAITSESSLSSTFRKHKTHQSSPDPKPKPKPKPKPEPIIPKRTVSSFFLSTFSTTKTTTTTTTTTNNKKKRVGSSSFMGMGCATSSPASAPEVIRSSADWQSKKVRKKKQRKKTPKTTSFHGPQPVADVCCAPGIGFVSDAALVDCVESTRPLPPRPTRVHLIRPHHRERSCTTRGVPNMPPVLNTSPSNDISRSGSEFFNARQHRQFRRRPYEGGLSEIMMFQSSLLFGGSFNVHDRYGNLRLDVDNMSYEELLDLSDMIGYVGTGLQEEEIIHCLRKNKLSLSESIPLFSSDEDRNCSICQEEYKAGEETGKLKCGHCYHMYCIKQWLLQKNACPVCKVAAAASA